MGQPEGHHRNSRWLPPTHEWLPPPLVLSLETAPTFPTPGVHLAAFYNRGRGKNLKTCPPTPPFFSSPPDCHLIHRALRLRMLLFQCNYYFFFYKKIKIRIHFCTLALFSFIDTFTQVKSFLSVQIEIRPEASGGPRFRGLVNRQSHSAIRLADPFCFLCVACIPMNGIPSFCVFPHFVLLSCRSFRFRTKWEISLEWSTLKSRWI